MNDRKQEQVDYTAADSGVGLVTGAAIGGVIGATFGNYGLGLIFGSLVGIVLGPGFGLALRTPSSDATPPKRDLL